MKPVHQTQFAAEVSEKAGNCLAACIASVLELPLEKVPNFAAIPGDDGEWWAALQEFIGLYGFTFFQSVALTEGVISVGYGRSPRGDFKHNVVFRGTEMIHDPHPDGRGLDGPPLEFWVFVALDPGRWMP